MHYSVLASDYDGTLAGDGVVLPSALQAIERLLESGRKLVLVTGRELDELLQVFPQVELCEWVVAENGAVLYHPASRREVLLGERPPERFLRELDRQGVEPYSVGRVIVGTWRPHEDTVFRIIRDLRLDLQVIFNKRAVMILPTGINKATGVTAALAEMHVLPSNVVGIGDAENDQALLEHCGYSVAVENALPPLKARADYVTERARGAGVEEIIDHLITDDLQVLATRARRDRPGKMR